MFRYNVVFVTAMLYWCEAIPAFVYPMLSGGQHAVWDETDWKTQLPPRMGATPFLLYTHFSEKLSGALQHKVAPPLIWNSSPAYDVNSSPKKDYPGRS